MSKIVELYVRELTREGSTMTINDVPKKLRKQVEDAIAALKAAANAGTAPTRPAPSLILPSWRQKQSRLPKAALASKPTTTMAKSNAAYTVF